MVQNRENQGNDGNLQITGVKILNRNERKVQNLYVQELAARIIQKRYRGFVGRKHLMKIKFELLVVFIQSMARMFVDPGREL